MSQPLVDRIPFAKILTMLSIIFGIALGMCGLTALLLKGSNTERLQLGLGMIELIFMLLSGVGIVIMLALWTILSISKSLTYISDESQEEFEDKGQ